MSNGHMTDSDVDESQSSSSDYTENLIVSLNKIRTIECDLVKILFGREKAMHYVRRTNGIEGLVSLDQHYQDTTNSRVTETLTDSIETLTFTGTDTVNIPVTVVSIASSSHLNQTTCCEFCCSRQKIYPTRTAPYSSYSVANKTLDLLPPKDQKDLKKITLILDIDETLVHSTFVADPHADFHFYMTNDDITYDIYVSVRPGLHKFLKRLSKYFELVTFTTARQNYADYILDRIDPNHYIKYRLYRESCVIYNGTFVKDLAKLGRDLRKVIIVDNSPACYMLQPYNGLAIQDFNGNPEDNELEHITEFLVKNYKCDNVMELFSN